MREHLFGEQDEQTTALEGVVERITYSNAENAWSVVKIALPGRREAATAVGNLLGVRPGENLRLTGRWTTDRKYGAQFKVDSYVTIEPSTLAGIRRYLGSGLVPGIGPVMADRLVDKFGLATLEVIDASPERLAEVEGIGPFRSERIRKAWSEQRGIKDVMIFLQGQGISTGLAIKIYKQYADRAIAVVKEDPYRLATEVFGIGFRSADRIAENLGIPKDSPRRIRAGVLHRLAELADEGHVFAPRERLVQEAAVMLGIDAGPVEVALDALASDGTVIPEPHGEDSAVYLRLLHGAEAGAARRLRELLAQPAVPITIDVERALAWVGQRMGVDLAPRQQEAVREAVTRKVLVITGGPGTGKTTLVRAILEILERKGRRILLAAPTGRAAKRLAEATGREARTIHRLLEFNPRTGQFARTKGQALAADMVVVDEVSMLDIVLFHRLLEALPDACQLVLVGDVDQLPSVGPGAVLADLIRSGVPAIVRLEEIFRQAERSRIVIAAHAVNKGEMPTAEAASSADFVILERAEPEQILATIRSLLADRLPRRFALDPIDEIQVLAPMHKGLIGAANLNRELQQLLNPGGAALVRGERTLRRGDKVMQIRNNYDHEVFNGDIGRIASIDDTMKTVGVRFDDRTVMYDYADLDELTLAYACSVHKAQGSEYPCVIIPVHTQHYVMLQRNLLYTAITRGRRLVVLVGSRRAIAVAVRNAHVAPRWTRLAERLRAG